jgi:hypothetical protein
MAKFDKTWVVDAAERVVSTFGEAFAGVLVSNGVAGLNLSIMEQAATSGVIAVAALAKAAAAGFNSKRGAGLLVAAKPVDG